MNEVETIKFDFPVGKIMASYGVLNRLSRCQINILLLRHATCEWSGKEAENNKKALEDNATILATYEVKGLEEPVKIITSYDRKATTLSLENEDFAMEVFRKRLNKKIENDGTSSKDVLRESQQVDIIVNQGMKVMNG